MIDESAIRLRFEVLAPVLDEHGRRRFAAAEAMAAGPGGVSAVMRATGIARSTIRRGLDELADGDAPEGEHVRRAGGGRKPLSATNVRGRDPAPNSQPPHLPCPFTRAIFLSVG